MMKKKNIHFSALGRICACIGISLLGMGYLSICGSPVSIVAEENEKTALHDIYAEDNRLKLISHETYELENDSVLSEHGVENSYTRISKIYIVIVIMGCFGAVNGVVISVLKVPPFIATLGMQTIIYGLCSLITNNQPMGGYKKSYLTVASGSLGPIPYLMIFAAIVGVYFWFLYNKTRHGKYMYAIGGNENAEQVAGVNVRGSLIRIYILAGCMRWQVSL